MQDYHALFIERTARGDMLPAITVTRNQRIAQALTNTILSRYRVSSVILHTAISDEPSKPSFAIAEILSLPTCEVETPLHRTPLNNCQITNIRLEEMDVVQSILLDGGSSCAMPFARTGWTSELLEWLQPVGIIQGPVEVRQLHGNGLATLLQLRSAGGATCWVKAVEPNLKREYAATLALTRMFPRFLPPVVSSRDDWRCWVTLDVGSTIDSMHDPKTLLAVSHDLARLHLSSYSTLPTLQSIGCRDLREESVISELDSLGQFWIKAMALQTSTRAARLPPDRIKSLIGILGEKLSTLIAFNLPASLIHNDPNPGNIVVAKSRNGARRVRFLDWREAFIGNPLANFHQVLRWLRRACNLTPSVESECRSAYMQIMRSGYEDASLSRAYNLSGVLSHLYYLLGACSLAKTEVLDDPNFQSYARTIARQIDADVNTAHLQR